MSGEGRPAKRKIAVTGSTGQLGTLLLRRLIYNRTVGEVVCLDVRPPRLDNPKLTAITADIRDDDIDRHFHGCDAVVHLAFVIDRYLPRDRYDSINVEGSKNVFRAAARAGASHLVYCSSAAAYGMVPGHPEPLIETSPRIHQAEFSYADAKFRIEDFLDTFEARHPELRVTRLRPVALLGQRMENTMGRLLRRRRVPSIGDAPLPIVWDEDVAEAIALVLDRGTAGAFNLAADQPLPPEELADTTVLRPLRLGRRTALVSAHLSTLLARFGIGAMVDPAWITSSSARLVLSSDKARQELGWKPRCPTAVDVMRHFLATVPARLDRRLAAFRALAGLYGRFGPYQPELKRVRLKIHLDLTGPTGGDFGIEVRDGRLLVTNSPPRPAEAIVTVPATVFLDLLAGRTDWGATQLTGKSRAEGQAHAPMVIAGMIANFRVQMAGPDASGLARAVGRWFESGAT